MYYLKVETQMDDLLEAYYVFRENNCSFDLCTLQVNSFDERLQSKRLRYNGLQVQRFFNFNVIKYLNIFTVLARIVVIKFLKNRNIDRSFHPVHKCKISIIHLDCFTQCMYY